MENSQQFEKIGKTLIATRSNNKLCDFAKEVSEMEDAPKEVTESLDEVVKFIGDYRNLFANMLDMQLELHDSLKEYTKNREGYGEITPAEEQLVNRLFSLLKSGKNKISEIGPEADLGKLTPLILKIVDAGQS